MCPHRFHPFAFRGIHRMLALLFALGFASRAIAYEDRDGNRIDDRIDAVHTLGWSAAFVNGDPGQHMRIGVENAANVVYAIYVRYDHRPSMQDQVALSLTGVSMVWPFVNITYIESRATFAQIDLIRLLPGVTAVEAVPVD